MYRLCQETKEDWWEVEALYDLCFAPGREALSSYRLRDNTAPIEKLCIVVRDSDDILAGAIRYWPVDIGEHKALLLGPIAIHPTRQGEGLGGTLMIESLKLAQFEGWSRVMLIGDAPYYMRFGFTKLQGIEMPPPTNPDRILGLSLYPDAWNGVSGKVSPAS